MAFLKLSRSAFQVCLPLDSLAAESIKTPNRSGGCSKFCSVAELRAENCFAAGIPRKATFASAENPRPISPRREPDLDHLSTLIAEECSYTKGPFAALDQDQPIHASSRCQEVRAAITSLE